MEKYRSIAYMLVHHLRRNEEVERVGMKRKDVVNWYLEQIESEIPNEQALEQQRDLVQRVITNLVVRVWPTRACGTAVETAPGSRRLMGGSRVRCARSPPTHQDHVLIALRPPQAEGDAEPDPDDMAIVVHPNFVID